MCFHTTAFYDTDMKYFFLKQENMLMTWQQIKQREILHFKHGSWEMDTS